MIVGIGIDIVDLSRVRWTWRRRGDRFTGRILSAAERRALPRGPEGRFLIHLAGRLAIKEAVLKALGTGLSGGIRWHDLEVTSSARGRPEVTLHGAALKAARKRKIARIHVTVSHDAGCAAAAAVAESGS